MTGNKGQRLKWLAVISLVLGVGVAAVLWGNHRRVGRALDSYRGVAVYDNGLLFFRSYGRHYSADGYYYGQVAVHRVDRIFREKLSPATE